MLDQEAEEGGPPAMLDETNPEMLADLSSILDDPFMAQPEALES